MAVPPVLGAVPPMRHEASREATENECSCADRGKMAPFLRHRIISVESTQ